MASNFVITATTPAQRPAWPKYLSIYAALHGIWVVCYALLGKGFAYAGFPPLYVGEILLFLAIASLLASRRTTPLMLSPVGWLTMAFAAWQILCTVPYLQEHGIDTLRDSVIWVYAIFGWVTAALILRLRGLLPKILKCFSVFGRTFLILGPVAFLSSLYLRDVLPQWPGTTVSVPLIKGGEYCVHLAAILAFITVRLGNMRGWWLVLVLCDALVAMSARGGLLAFMAAAGFVLLLRPKVERLAIVLGTTMLLIVSMAAFDLEIATPKADREFSLEQLSDSVVSMFSSSEQAALESTKSWRLAWWSKIWGYTMKGPYFWTGKGYGVNLADSDGFQVGTREEPLRSPHSSHLTILARSGVPGFLLWIVLQITWARSMLASHVRARHLGMQIWASLFAWVLSYWIAFIVSAAFDVSLEGPMAGIPFWTLFGIGWGSTMLFRFTVLPSAKSPMPVMVQRPLAVRRVGSE